MEYLDYKVNDLDLLFDLINYLSFIDGSLSSEEADIIKKLVNIYDYNGYMLSKVQESELLNRLEKVTGEELKNLLVISIFVAYSDGIIDKNEAAFLRKTSELLSKESKTAFLRLLDSKIEKSVAVTNLFTPEILSKEKNTNEYLSKFQKGDESDVKIEKLNLMRRGPIKKVWVQVISLWNIIKSNEVTKSKKAIAVGALLYLIAPIDLIPDLIPIAGLTDDVGVIVAAVGQLAPYFTKK